MNTEISRRGCLKLFASAFAPLPVLALEDGLKRQILSFLEQQRRSEGSYGWTNDVTGQLTPTFATVGCYRLLGVEVPYPKETAAFVRSHYPAPETRRTDRPLWRLDFEQVQTLAWLSEPLDIFKALASTWTKPADFTTRYELGGNPVLQHQAMAVRVRHLVGLSPGPDDPAWKSWFLTRRRANGTFNNTPASDGSDGHVMNTWWGLLAADSLDLKLSTTPDLAQWTAACQLSSGGFTYAPGASIGAVDDVAYTWCALQILRREKTTIPHRDRCIAWLEALLTEAGGYQDRPGGEANALATFYALECFRLLEHEPRSPAARANRAPRTAPPAGHGVFSIQIEAPGNGSAQEAAFLAKALGIHLWMAKNAPAGWIAEAQRQADADGVAVRFGVGDEEYGTYFGLPGLGCYSHLVDLVAPREGEFGARMPKQKHPYTWHQFRDERIPSLHKGGGRLIWQFNENEEWSRILLDDAVATGAYSAIASFHFGKQNFLQTYPFLNRWYGRLPFVGLQDAHSRESWWWGNQLAGYTTLFIAKEPTWDGWLEALQQNWVMAVRHDAVTGWTTHVAGGPPEVRAHVMRRQKEWRWWDDAGRQSRRPGAALSLLRPGMQFEAGAPAAGASNRLALRVRLWHENSQQGRPLEPHAELLELRVDGVKVDSRLHESQDDRFYLYDFQDTPEAHSAEVRVKLLDSGSVTTISKSWRSSL